MQTPPPTTPPVPPAAPLFRKAQALEAAFLAEMLKYAAPPPAPGAFGGGIGESQFQSFLREEQARGMTAAGGLGLAAQLYESLAGGRP